MKHVFNVLFGLSSFKCSRLDLELELMSSHDRVRSNHGHTGQELVLLKRAAREFGQHIDLIGNLLLLPIHLGIVLRLLLGSAHLLLLAISLLRLLVELHWLLLLLLLLRLHFDLLLAHELHPLLDLLFVHVLVLLLHPLQLGPFAPRKLHVGLLWIGLLLRLLFEFLLSSSPLLFSQLRLRLLLFLGFFLLFNSFRRFLNRLCWLLIDLLLRLGIHLLLFIAFTALLLLAQLGLCVFEFIDLSPNSSLAPVVLHARFVQGEEKGEAKLELGNAEEILLAPDVEAASWQVFSAGRGLGDLVAPDPVGAASCLLLVPGSGVGHGPDAGLVQGDW